MPVSRIADAMSGISEVFMVRNQLVHLMERFRAGELDGTDVLQSWDLLDSALRRGVGDIERATMSMRMTSMHGVFTRMGRVVQSYVAQARKQILFKTRGEETELDKKVLDALSEPLVHLIRNAMDHGIELPDARESVGKPRQGTITLSARMTGSEVLIEIADDGKGIDPKRILKSAQEKGIDTSKVTDDRSAVELIFLPGFSTAEAVSDVSGRGGRDHQHRN